MKSCSNSSAGTRRARDDSGSGGCRCGNFRSTTAYLESPGRWVRGSVSWPEFQAVFSRASLNIYGRPCATARRWWSRVKRDRSNLRPVAESGRRISGRSAGFISQSTRATGHQVAADPVVLPASILNPPSGAAAVDERPRGRLPGMTPAVAGWNRPPSGRVRVVAAASHAGLWYREVWDQASAGHAERTVPFAERRSRVCRSVFQPDIFAATRLFLN